jgi:hypothetical protein
MTLASADLATIPDYLLDIPNELRQLLDSLSGNIADWGLETFLNVMKLSFDASRISIILLVRPGLKGFDSNLKGFSGGYAFGTKDGGVQASAVFNGGKMQVLEDEAPDWDVKVLFKDVGAFWKFVFSGGNDILEAILENDVEVYGNLNYLYKFGFMAKDLRSRLNLG